MQDTADTERPMLEECSIDTDFTVVLLNATGDILDARESCQAILGWPRGELIGQNLTVLLKCGRDALLTRLVQMQGIDREPAGDTAFSIQVIVTKKNGDISPLVVTVRRFLQLGCWTATFHPRHSDLEEESAPPASAQIDRIPGDPIEEHLNTASNQAGGQSEPVKPNYRNMSLLFPSAAAQRGCSVGETPSLIVPTRTPSEGLQQICEIVALPQTAPSVEDRHAAPERSAPSELLEAAEDGCMLDIETRVSVLSGHVQTLLRELNQTVEAERTYHRRIQALEERERRHQAELAKAREDLDQALAKLCSTEGKLKEQIELSNSLRISRHDLDEVGRDLQRVDDTIAARLKVCRSELHEATTRLHEESTERQRLQALLTLSRKEFDTTCEELRLEIEKHRIGRRLQRIEEHVTPFESGESRVVDGGLLNGKHGAEKP